jgi:hypothetical protein
MSPTLMATLGEAAQVGIALGCAYVLMTVLKSSALIKQKSVQIGGAAAIFVVVFFLLNRYLPSIQYGFLQEAVAAQPVTVSKPQEAGNKTTVAVALSPAVQLVTSRDLTALDKNVFALDETLLVAVRIPSGGSWRVGPVDSYEAVGLQDVPMMGMGREMGSILLGDPGKRDIFAVQRIKGTEVVVGADSQMNSLSFSINPFGDRQFLKKVLKAQGNFSQTMGIPDPFGGLDEHEQDKLLEKVGTLIADKVSSAITVKGDFQYARRSMMGCSSPF